MSSSLPDTDARAKEISFSEDEFTVTLADGRRLSVPLAWFPRLLHATRDQLEHHEFLDGGAGIHWPDLDEDISVASLLLPRGGSAA